MIGSSRRVDRSSASDLPGPSFLAGAREARDELERLLLDARARRRWAADAIQRAALFGARAAGPMNDRTQASIGSHHAAAGAGAVDAMMLARASLSGDRHAVDENRADVARAAPVDVVADGDDVAEHVASGCRRS